MPAADQGHELRGGERSAAEVEEVVVGSGDGQPEDAPPVLGEGLADGIVSHRSTATAVRVFQRPRKGGTVDLAGGADRQLVHDRQEGHQRRRKHLAEVRQRRTAVEPVGIRHGEIADEDVVAGGRATHSRCRSRDARKLLERRLHLAQLDAPATDLDLVVGAADIEQAWRSKRTTSPLR